MKTIQKNLVLTLVIAMLSVASIPADATRHSYVNVTPFNEEYHGKYSFIQKDNNGNSQEMVITISTKDKQLVLEISTEPGTIYKLDPVAANKDHFTISENGQILAKVDFTRDTKGKVASFFFQQGEGKYEWKRK